MNTRTGFTVSHRRPAGLSWLVLLPAAGFASPQLTGDMSQSSEALGLRSDVAHPAVAGDQTQPGPGAKRGGGS